jgi:hypothetical protein
MSWFEGMSCKKDRSSVSATVGWMRSRPEGASDERPGCGAGEFRNHLNATSVEKHFSTRNAPYCLCDSSNGLKLRQNGVPSERTKRHKSLMQKVFSHFFLPHCYSQLLSANVTAPFRTTLHCLIGRLGPALAPVVVASLFAPTPRRGNHHLLARGQWRSPA